MKLITNTVPGKVRRILTPTLGVAYSPPHGRWSYTHHPSIIFFRGKFHAIFSSGKANEDDIGQRVLHTTSTDGIHWLRHSVLFDSQPGAVLTACGLYTDGSHLVAYAGTYAYAKENVLDGHCIHTGDLTVNTSLLAKVSGNGEDFGEILDLHLPITPNHGPQMLRSGRLLISGCCLFPYSDDPSGIGAYTLSGIPPFPHPGIADDPQGHSFHCALRHSDVPVCEGSYYQTDNGTIHMLLRSSEHVLYQIESTDDGATWSSPEPTAFTNANTKFHCGRLPDGRFYVVGSPDPAGARCPLVISLSEDGFVFDEEFVIDGTYRQLRTPGKQKNGIYGYPHTIIENGIMYVICSICKEDIFVYSFPLSALQQS